MNGLIEILLTNGFTVEKDINTNNSWGFGGAIKDVYTKDTIRVVIGIAYYRHAPATPFIRVFKDGESLFDELNNKCNRNKAITLITSLI